MPIYLRRCEQCGFEEETIETLNDEVKDCPECSGPFKKQITAPTFCYVRGESALDMYGELDKRREKAANGQGNATIKMSMNERGEVTTDSVEASGAFKNAYTKQE